MNGCSHGKKVLSGTDEGISELGGVRGGLAPPTSAQARTAEEKGLYLGKYAFFDYAP